MGRQAPKGLLGIHLNFLSAFPFAVGAALFGGLVPAGLFKRIAIAVIANRAEKKEPVALDALAALFRRGYFVEMPEHPQTIGYALTDTPVGMAAWMLDHDADSYQKISHAFLDGQPSGGLTRDRIVDNMTLYWLTNTATSSARLYWENFRTIFAAIASGEKSPELSLPVAFTVFPDEIFKAPRAGPKRSIPTSSTLTRPRRAGTSPPGKSRRSSRANSARHLGHFDRRSYRAPLCTRNDLEPTDLFASLHPGISWQRKLGTDLLRQLRTSSRAVQVVVRC